MEMIRNHSCSRKRWRLDDESRTMYIWLMELKAGIWIALVGFGSTGGVNVLGYWESGSLSSNVGQLVA